MIRILIIAAVAIASIAVFKSIADAKRGGYNYPNPQLGRCFKSCDNRFTPYTRSHRRCIRECYLKYGR